ncbi:uncharacterized protein LOC129919585 [Episyrphus balteatus]|uniref:uncharacterized protein LOC129919585 n=1 Tax=Episyrphus balteatus TaxID=286459 RepID=UPI0024867F26|nr:uncharacterized protein LOC129919585 [Episyrphus balteatus]
MCDTPVNDEPAWLDSAFVLKILTKYSKSPIKEIKSFTKQPATAKGENYASVMTLLNVKYVTEQNGTVESVSFIVKSRVDNEVFSAIEEEYNIFQRELQVYSVFMKEAEDLLRSIGDETIFGPRAIYLEDGVIVQENLKIKGYHIVDVKKGLNLDQITAALEKLAKFHATSMVLYRKNPELFKHHMAGNISENPTPLHYVYTNAIETSIEYCKSNKNLQQYVPKLEEFGTKIVPKMINVFSRNKVDRFHVLNHGDLWVNNMMFKSDKDVLFVDYQEGYFGSPGIDLNWFIFSSWPTDIFTNQRDQLIEVYQNVLKNVLQKLEYDQRIPTTEDVKREIVNKGYHGLSTATCLLPILINENQELADAMNFILDTDEAKENRRKVFDNPAYGNRLAVFLEFFHQNGII